MWKTMLNSDVALGHGPHVLSINSGSRTSSVIVLPRFTDLSEQSRILYCDINDGFADGQTLIIFKYCTPLFAGTHPRPFGRKFKGAVRKQYRRQHGQAPAPADVFLFPAKSIARGTSIASGSREGPRERKEGFWSFPRFCGSVLALVSRKNPY